MEQGVIEALKKAIKIKSSMGKKGEEERIGANQ